MIGTAMIGTATMMEQPRCGDGAAAVWYDSSIDGAEVEMMTTLPIDASDAAEVEMIVDRVDEMMTKEVAMTAYDEMTEEASLYVCDQDSPIDQSGCRRHDDYKDDVTMMTVTRMTMMTNRHQHSCRTIDQVTRRR